MSFKLDQVDYDLLQKKKKMINRITFLFFWLLNVNYSNTKCGEYHRKEETVRKTARNHAIFTSSADAPKPKPHAINLMVKIPST